MEEYLKLKDEYKIDDSHSKIRGVIVCKTEDGKVIFTKENMIVKDGRKLILQKVFGSDGTALEFHAVSGSEYKMTAPDDTVSTQELMYRAFGSGDVASTIKEEAFESVDSEQALEPSKYYINMDELYAHFRVRKEGGGSGSVTSSFGLAVKVGEANGENTGYKLFSRVTFPSYPDSVNLIFDYYIYF